MNAGRFISNRTRPRAARSRARRAGLFTIGGKKTGLAPSLLVHRYGLALLIASIGLIGVGFPFAQAWEEDLGLTWLFRLRGPIAPPTEVVVVSIDRESSERLGLPNVPRKWPRDLHARLLDRLTEQGASVIAFDMMFQDPREPGRDRAFAEAMRRAGNVILFEQIKKDILPPWSGAPQAERAISIEQRISPIPALADAALGLAPFALPRVPIKVSQVWLFKPEAGGAATLPMLALYAHRPAAKEQLLAQLKTLAPRPDESLDQAQARQGGPTTISEQVDLLRQRLRRDPALAKQLLRGLNNAETSDEAPSRHAAALVAALAGPDSLHLNYYGPPRTIKTLAYHEVVLGEDRGRANLAGRAVFIGAAARLQPDQRDGFYTPFTQASGLDISGVEIAATTFANLLEGNAVASLRPLGEALLVLAWGLALGLGLRRFGAGWIPLVAALAAIAYCSVAFVAFAQWHWWLPLVVPLAIQLPIATLAAILWRYSGLRRERENIRHAFGMHLPLHVVDQLAHGIDDFNAATELAQGICLVTDIEQYTTLAERLAPTALKALLNDYFEVLYRPVTRRGGVIANVVGDSMLAIWTTKRDRPALRQAACDAAVEILAAVEEFNRSHPEARLPTRLGLHSGELILGHVGTAEHYEYRPFGDIVNTASRIEGLGKRLDARALASEEVVAGLDVRHLRPLGRFLLKGKTRPLGICELMPDSGLTEARLDGLLTGFAQGLERFIDGDFDKALQSFEAIEHDYGQDGPTRFYRRLCRRYRDEPPDGEWRGIVRLDHK